MAEEGKLTLKVSYRGEVRRLRDWRDEEPSFQRLLDASLGLFELSESEAQSLSLQYQDGDGAVPLTPENLPEAFSLAARDGLLRLSLVRPEALEQGQAGEVQPERLQVEAEPSTQSLESESVPSSWSCFKQQVVSDFRTNYQDMQDAFKDRQHPALNVCGKVAGLTAGVCASARLIPLHGTRLAARSVATAANMPVSEHDVQAPPASAGTVPPEGGDDVQHFKQQVLQDFQVGRQEIQAAFGYFTGSTGSSESSASEPARLGRDVLPAVASTVAGLTVASTLVPLRAARLVVASLASQREEPRPEAQGDQRAEPGPVETLA